MIESFSFAAQASVLVPGRISKWRPTLRPPVPSLDFSWQSLLSTRWAGIEKSGFFTTLHEMDSLLASGTSEELMILRGFKAYDRSQALFF